MPTEEVKELTEHEKERPEINRLIRIKAVSGARPTASSILDLASSTSSTNHYHTHDLKKQDPLARFKGTREYAEDETKIALDDDTNYQMAIITETNEHLARLCELSAYLAASLVLDKFKDEVVRIMSRVWILGSLCFLLLAKEVMDRAGNGSGDVGGDDEVPKELYLPRAFEAWRRGMAFGGAVSKIIREEDAAMLLNVITDAIDEGSLG